MIIDLGLIDYGEAYKIQREFVRRRKLGEIGDTILFTEHYPVFTIGRTGNIANLLEGEPALAARGIKVLRVDRGGDITFHGPGQLVIYPIIDLAGKEKDLHLYMRNLEEAAIRLASDYSICAERVAGRTGVWVGGAKLASIGIAASNWITYHGMAVNVNTDLKFFSMINPCGARGVKAASLKELLGQEICMEDTKYVISRYFKDVFRVEGECIENRSACTSAMA